jgi:hypothetical protein
MNNTIVAKNTGGDILNNASLTGSHNLIGDGSGGSGLTHTTTGDPKLASLANNGGPTQTMALQFGSTAIGGVPANTSGTPSTDQRGFTRDTTAATDIGAYQVQPISFTTTSLSGGTVGTPYNQTITAVEAGVSSFTFAITSGSLPLGLRFDPVTGTISGTPFQTGQVSFTVTAADSNGFTASQSCSVTIAKPQLIITVPASMAVEGNTTGGAIVTFSVTATDNVDPSPTVTCIPSSGSVFPLGTTTVTCTATDSFRNTASASFMVTVVDTTPPQLTVPANLTVLATSAQGAIVTYTATATDIVDPAPTVTSTWPSGSLFPVGTTTVTVTATDKSGNEATAPFTVTINPPAPVITSPTNGYSSPSTAVTVSGTGLPNGSVQLFDRGTAIGSPVTADGPGNFSETITLPVGVHSLTATQSVNGATSSASGSLSVTINPPAPVITSPTNGYSSPSTAVTVSGTGTPGDSVQLYDGSTAIGSPVTVNSNGQFSEPITLAVSVVPHALTATQSLNGATSSASGSISVTILTYSKATSNLQALVDGAGLDQGMQNSLDSQLQAALADFNAGDTADGVSQLQDFINHVNAQRDKKITDYWAKQFIPTAQGIINAVG